jgi:hypothetical protein
MRQSTSLFLQNLEQKPATSPIETMMGSFAAYSFSFTRSLDFAYYKAFLDFVYYYIFLLAYYYYAFLLAYYYARRLPSSSVFNLSNYNFRFP